MIERYKKMEYTVKQIAELIGVTKPTVQTAIKKLNIQPLRTDKVNRAFYSIADTVVIIKEVKPTYDFSNQFGEKPQNLESKNRKEPQSNLQEILQDLAKNGEDNSQNHQIPKENETKTAKENRKTAQNINTDYDLLKNYIQILEMQIKEKDKQLDLIYKQFESKDKQIEEKDKQIQELLNRLTQSMDLTKGLQYITAADKTTQMLQANGGAVQRQDQEQQQEPQEQEVQTAVKIQDQAEPQQKKKKNNLLHRLFNKS